MARFLDNLLRLLNRLVEPSTQADDAAGALSKADALNALAESGDFRIVPHLLPFFAKGDALSRQAAQAITTLMRGLGPSEIAWLDEQARVDSYGCRDDAWWRLTAAEVPRVAEIAGHDPHVLSMLASHPRGFVRAAAVEALSAINSGDEIPFLALRANDWVEPIAESAAALLAARLRPENRHAVIDALPFIVRMLGRRRRDHRRFAEATRSVLLSDDGQMLATRLSTFSPEVRRLAFRLVSSDITSLDHPLFTASLCGVRCARTCSGTSSSRKLLTGFCNRV